MNGYRKWFYTTLLLMLIPLLGMAGFNYYIDPLWNFSHSNRHNSIQLSFDERQQKTNQVTFGTGDYDTLLLGSSRVTYIDQRDFKGHKTYNYAVSLMDLQEYYDFIEYAKTRHGGEFDCIIIGLDFYATNKNLPNDARPASFYIDKSRQFAYRYKTLLSRDVFKYAVKNYQASQKGVPLDFAYDRHNVKTLTPITRQAQAGKIQANLDKYSRVVYANYAYEDVYGILYRIKRANPHTKFIIFTTPEAKPLYDLMVEQGLFPYYERWLRDIVGVFGGVYNFDCPNSITSDLTNYCDASHVYPRVGTLMAYRMVHYDTKVPDDFGILVTGKNIDQHLAIIKEEAEK